MSCPNAVDETSDIGCPSNGDMISSSYNQGDLQRRMKLRLTGERRPRNMYGQIYKSTPHETQHRICIYIYIMCACLYLHI